jgi:hypothetical protein
MPTGVGAGKAKVFIYRVRGYPGLHSIFLKFGHRNEYGTVRYYYIQRGVGTCLQRNALTSSESDPRGTLRKPPLCVSQTRAQSSCQHRSEPVWQWFVYTASDTGLTPRTYFGTCSDKSVRALPAQLQTYHIHSLRHRAHTTHKILNMLWQKRACSTCTVSDIPHTQLQTQGSHHAHILNLLWQKRACSTCTASDIPHTQLQTQGSHHGILNLL